MAMARCILCERLLKMDRLRSLMSPLARHFVFACIDETECLNSLHPK